MFRSSKVQRFLKGVKFIEKVSALSKYQNLLDQVDSVDLNFTLYMFDNRLWSILMINVIFFLIKPKDSNTRNCFFFFK